MSKRVRFISARPPPAWSPSSTTERASPTRRAPSTGAGWSGALHSRRRPVPRRVGAAGRRCGGRLDGRRVVAALGAARRPSRARGLWVQAQRPITGEASWEGRHQSNGRKHSSLSPCLDPKIGTAGARGGGTRSPAVPIHNCCRTFHPRDRGTSGQGHWNSSVTDWPLARYWPPRSTCSGPARGVALSLAGFA